MCDTGRQRQRMMGWEVRRVAPPVSGRGKEVSGSCSLITVCPPTNAADVTPLTPENIH